VLRTELRLSTPPLSLVFEDFCPPQESAYFDLRLGEVAGKQAVRYNALEGYVLQYFRDFVIAVGGSRPDIWRCGKAWGDQPQSAKQDLYDGHLNGQPEDIGDVNFALGWHMRLGTGQSRQIEIFMCADKSRERTSRNLPRLIKTGATALEEKTRQSDAAFVNRRRPVRVPPRFEQAYVRSLLALSLLADVDGGAIIAAPEFDPSYERCGGYGYCWPRDATLAALALRAAGYPEYLQRLAGWYQRTQLGDGLWAFYQIDESATALLGLSIYVQDDPESLPQMWPAIEKAAEALTARVTPDGWHLPACDLWETYCGAFAYSNAAVSAGLRQAAVAAQIGGCRDLSERWAAAAEATRQATISSFNGSYFPRGLASDGQVDPVVDSSVLGVVTPFDLLRADNPEHRRMIEATVEVIESRLGQRLDGGRGIRRYEGDCYLGGVIGCVNTLWLALVLLKVSRSYRQEDPARAEAARQRAACYVDFCLEHATPTGLLPELIGTADDTPYWAAPHSWASGLLVECVLEMDEPGG